MSGKSSITIRAMKATDIDRVVEITSGLDHAPQWPTRVYEAALSEFSPTRIILVAEEAGAGVVVGFAVAVMVPPEAELESIAVSASYQRQGVARSLFESIMAEFSRVQVREVVLEVRNSNEEARSFYTSLAFVEEGRRPGYYADPVEDAILMRLNVGGTPDAETMSAS
jgi:ribosomal-protein-alanine N-acetyltransferase